MAMRDLKQHLLLSARVGGGIYLAGGDLSLQLHAIVRDRAERKRERSYRLRTDLQCPRLSGNLVVGH